MPPGWKEGAEVVPHNGREARGPRCLLDPIPSALLSPSSSLRAVK